MKQVACLTAINHAGPSSYLWYTELPQLQVCHPRWYLPSSTATAHTVIGTVAHATAALPDLIWPALSLSPAGHL